MSKKSQSKERIKPTRVHGFDKRKSDTQTDFPHENFMVTVGGVAIAKGNHFTTAKNARSDPFEFRVVPDTPTGKVIAMVKITTNEELPIPVVLSSGGALYYYGIDDAVLRSYPHQNALKWLASYHQIKLPQIPKISSIKHMGYDQILVLDVEGNVHTISTSNQCDRFYMHTHKNLKQIVAISADGPGIATAVSANHYAYAYGLPESAESSETSQFVQIPMDGIVSSVHVTQLYLVFLTTQEQIALLDVSLFYSQRGLNVNQNQPVPLLFTDLPPISEIVVCKDGSFWANSKAGESYVYCGSENFLSAFKDADPELSATEITDKSSIDVQHFGKYVKEYFKITRTEDLDGMKCLGIFDKYENGPRSFFSNVITKGIYELGGNYPELASLDQLREIRTSNELKTKLGSPTRRRANKNVGEEIWVPCTFKRCTSCHSRALIKCPKCRNSVFCGQSCLRQHWHDYCGRQ